MSPIASMIGRDGTIRRPPGVVAYQDVGDRYVCGFGVPSDSQRGKDYRVFFDTAQDCWVCDCTGNINHGHCKHLKRFGLDGYTERYGRPKGEAGRRALRGASRSRQDALSDARRARPSPTPALPPPRPLRASQGDLQAAMPMTAEQAAQWPRAGQVFVKPWIASASGAPENVAGEWVPDRYPLALVVGLAHLGFTRYVRSQAAPLAAPPRRPALKFEPAPPNARRVSLPDVLTQAPRRVADDNEV